MQSAEAGVVLKPVPPFDFGLILRYLGRSPREPLDVVADGCYRRAVRLDGAPALLEVASLGTADAPALAVRLLDPGGAQVDSGGGDAPARQSAGEDAPATTSRAAGPMLREAERLVARCFRLEQDPRGLELVAAADPVFGALLARLRGARAVLMPSPFEALIWAILGQQITVSFAYALKRTLVERYGDAVIHDGQSYRLFPEPARLAAVPTDELRALQFSRQKAEYVVALAGVVAAGGIDWDGLRDAPTPDAFAALVQHRGIGRWTAEYVCMRGLGHPDVLPAGDLGLRAAIGRAYGLGRHADEVEVRALAERWAGWRSHAAFCWWYSLAPGIDYRAHGEQSDARGGS